MPRMKFANVLLERNPRSQNYPALYCRSDEAVVFDRESGEWLLYDEGTFDFTTYFNSLSVMKLKRYTTAKRFFLHLELKGAKAIVTQTTADALSAHPTLLKDAAVESAASDTWHALDIELAFPDDTVLVGFQIEAQGRVAIQNSYYSVEFEGQPRDVELALATTTFKKEHYIEANIALVKNELLGSDDDIASHFTMHVIDNGRTLDAEALSTDRVHVCPNSNVGGAGGFTYGMIRAMEQTPRATHVLLMDDDVAVSPESIKRTYNLLRIVNDEYSEAMVSGAMLNMEVGEEQWEDTGFMTPEGTFAPAKPQLHLNKFEDIVFNEAFKLPKLLRKLDQNYAAWWYCCIPLTVIEKNGLPLPVFVRCDDAEYGARCKTKFMTMNGLGIWHESFHMRYNAAVERYQTTRNTLIARYTTGFAPHADFLHELHNNIRLELKKFGYDNAELVLDAFEDFMKGPEFISKKGIAEQTFMAANRNKEKLVSHGEVQRQADALGLKNFDVHKLTRQLIDGDKPRSLIQRMGDLATDNSQRLVSNAGKGYAVIPTIGWAYPAGVIRGKRYLIVIDWYNRMGTIREKDTKRYDEIMKRYKADMARYKKEKADLARRYSEARTRLTSMAFWKDYLGL